MYVAGPRTSTILVFRRPLRSRVLLSTFLAVLLLSACEDPSNVGLGVIGESGGDPVRMELPPTAQRSEFEPTVTSNVRSSLGYTIGAARILTGSVVDPVFGTVVTKAYIDVARTSSGSTDYESGALTSVELILAPNYVYGDTMATTELVISEMGFDWPATNLPADTSLTVGAEIVRVEFPYPDSTITIAFPDDWILAHAADLLSVDIADRLDGFELSTTDPSAVVGFNASSALFRITTSTGVGDLIVSKIFTHVERTGDGAIPAGRAVLQDGTGQGLGFDFNFAADSIQGSAISRVVIELMIDQETLGDTPEHFVRPAPAQFDFLGIREDGTTQLLRSAVAGSESIRFVSTTAATGERTILRTVQRASAGNPDYVTYRVVISETQAAVNPILVFDSSADSDNPKAILTLTPNAF